MLDSLLSRLASYGNDKRVASFIKSSELMRNNKNKSMVFMISHYWRAVVGDSLDIMDINNYLPYSLRDGLTENDYIDMFLNKFMPLLTHRDTDV